MSVFSDRRSLRQIGGVRGYLRQVTWSLKWRLEWRRRRAGPAAPVQGPLPPSADAAPGGAGADHRRHQALG